MSEGDALSQQPAKGLSAHGPVHAGESDLRPADDLSISMHSECLTGCKFDIFWPF